ncbi:MAG TPA: bifunctional 5,10-methylene-tetrahydrofolate dehydrogenase/5,10-methylene-tetrahydrofolate cyclohydrolase, partial [Opitutaceae bacterium]|nr:bifunctional 5,10-methylene-tetrahydrofolate dehydrogenase/5,10-methylene-tetrahydrofolate cyclohydrolase [Opitutaceae bacterium]
ACTPAGIMELLGRSGVDLEGKHVVVLGRSLIVGKPAALLALQRKAGANATVTICHSKTANLASITRQADVLIAAIGRPEFVKADMVKPGVVVIDVGINRVTDASKKSGYRLVGDVDFAGVSPLCSRITPVPGGVGPMTVAMLMKNTVKAHRLLSSR